MLSFFRPRLANGLFAPIAWEIQLFYLNGISWPIQSDGRFMWRVAIKLILIVSFLLLCFMNEAELHYVVSNINDMGLALEGMATYMILVESNARMFNKGLRQQSFRLFLQEFYGKIFIEE